MLWLKPPVCHFVGWTYGSLSLRVFAQQFLGDGEAMGQRRLTFGILKGGEFLQTIPTLFSFGAEL